MRALLVVLGAGLLAGCTMIQQMMPSHREAERRAEELQELNLRVMRFADEYAGRVSETMSAFQASVTHPQERLEAQSWKVQQVDSAYTIASGPNPVSNALDMVVLATLSRLVMDDVWVPNSYGERAQSALEMHRKLEEGAWQLVEDVLTESQLIELRDIINRWRSENPNVQSVAYIHFREFAMSVKTNVAPGQGSLFALFGLDPLAQLDPAVREFAQTRELAERAIFYAQRTPDLFNLQIERLAYQFAVTPEMQSLLTGFDRASLIGSAADRLVTSMPDLLATEREALLAQLMQGLDDRQRAVVSLSGELRSTLQAGTETAMSLNTMLETADRMTARFSPSAQGSRAPATSEPFDIRQYTDMLRELTGTVREVETLAQHAETALPALSTTIETASDRLERITNRVFIQLLVLVVAAIVTTWAGAIAYRAAVFRMQQAAAKSG